MKLSKSQLKQIIKEESLKEATFGRGPGAGDFAMEPHASRGESDSTENVAVGKCWHETKHIPEEGLSAAINEYMQKVFSTELE